ncbi:AMP-binding protein [Pseudoalteromonas sp. DL2-H2.2]|uniref:AMP-binding protein n=1 Tax=Pseudoalteromonas sp. DL2-H2.2 TaxID=2908889 RepID=UPI001F3DCB92|nr:AMP-binding protein [Pseudoalteromonas sp. DL2-H2.2]MCF2909713.1 AMP-binding protein [Pseudoalteromonas sp. DL2-H2.2]
MNISEHLCQIAKTHSHLPAIFCEGNSLSYSVLLESSQTLSSEVYEKSNKIGILCYRDSGFYSSVFYCFLNRKTFVPLGVKFPLARLVSIIEQSELTTVIYTERYSELAQVLSQHFQSIEFICFESLSAKPLASPPASKKQGDDNYVAYVLFTSGSTGQPKGVPISKDNLSSYLNYMVTLLELDKSDKVSQIFDPTFDLSIHDILITWLSGACLYSLPESALFAPGKFIKEHELTVWFSVPATAAIMAKLGMLKKSAYPTLKWSLFCGEALPVAIAEQFQQAASNATLLNLYGPTEATIACSFHEFKLGQDYTKNYVPIGKPFSHMNFDIDQNGELLINGPQVFDGYLSNPERTQKSLFLKHNQTFYRSGDAVALNEQGEYEYLSRLDDQVKIQGYRIELSEIDSLTKKLLNNPLVVSLATPKQAPTYIALFICDNADTEVETNLVEQLSRFLPNYMLPKRVVWLDSMPLNSNGKIDKLFLHTLLENS